MYPYRHFTPILLVDITGLGFFESIANFFNNIFGAGYTTTAKISETEEKLFDEITPINFGFGSVTTSILTETGDSSKPISVYANQDVVNPIVSSDAGIKINILDLGLTINLSLDNTSVSVSYTTEDTESSVSLYIDLSELEVGAKTSSEIQTGDQVNETYADVTIDGWAIVAAVYSYLTNQPLPQTAK